MHEKRKRAPVPSIQNPVPIRCAPWPRSTSRVELPSKSHSSARGSSPIISPCNPRANDESKSQSSCAVQSNIREIADQNETRELERHLVRLLDEGDVQQQHAIKEGVRVFYVGQDVSNLNFLFRQQHGDRNDKVFHFPINEISRRYLRDGIAQVPREAFVLPEKSLVDELVHAYFTHINTGFPIIDEDHFMAQYDGEISDEPPSILLLQSILLAGAHVARDKKTRESLKSMFFGRAKVLFEARVERNRDLLVQAALLLTWYSDPVDDDVAANAHFWVGVAARIATGVGMHRNATPSKMVAHDKRMWRRVWWILVQVDVMVSLMYGRPQAV